MEREEVLKLYSEMFYYRNRKRRVLFYIKEFERKVIRFIDKEFVV
jgi:hypothetical protein